MRAIGRADPGSRIPPDRSCFDRVVAGSFLCSPGVYSGRREIVTAASYTNPVYPGAFPDPFVLKFQGEYWGYCTGIWHDGREFGVMRSRDLVCWEPLAA